MTEEDAIEVLERMAKSHYKNHEGIRVHVRSRFETIRELGKPDRVDNMYAVGITGNVEQGIFFEAQHEKLGEAVTQLFLNIAEARARSV